MSSPSTRDTDTVVLPPAPHYSIPTRVWNKLASLRGDGKPAAPAPLYPTVSLEYWKPEAHYSAVNFGDELSRATVELALARKAATLSDCTTSAHQLVAIGSVLHTARDGATVWGTGLHGSMPEIMHRYKTLDVRATRGPITRRFLQQRGISAPEIYGDPGVLAPLLTGDRFRPTGEFEIAFVPNLHDMEHLAESSFRERFPDIRIVDPLRAWNAVIADIVRYKTVLASSLHGVVIAEAFGIPARYVRLTKREALLKYEDYFEGTGRPIAYATSIEQALDMGGDTLKHYDPQPLLAAFPYDLWGL